MKIFLIGGKGYEIIWRVITIQIFFADFHEKKFAERLRRHSNLRMLVFGIRQSLAFFQSFPDDFVFLGSSVKSKYQQIGNAVPPLIGERFGERLVKYLSGTKLEKMPKTNYWDAERNINKPVP
jgi:site-specific DNA-cytosine methylase